MLFVSAISAYEVAQKVRLGKWPQAESLSLDWDELVASTDALSLPLESADALMAGRLSWDHRDPFDRLIAAQAMRRGYQLVSADRAPVVPDASSRTNRNRGKSKRGSDALV